MNVREYINCLEGFFRTLRCVLLMLVCSYTAVSLQVFSIYSNHKKKKKYFSEVKTVNQ